MGNIHDDNPFLERPARKLFKHNHDKDNECSFSSASMNRGSTLFPTRGGTTASTKPRRLVLTRVLPSNNINSVNYIPTHTASTTESLLSIPGQSFTQDATQSAPAPNEVHQAQLLPLFSTAEKESNIGAIIHREQEPNTRTTPKVPPGREYYDFIMQGMSTSMGLGQLLEAEIRNEFEEGGQHEIYEQGQEQGQEQEQEQEQRQRQEQEQRLELEQEQSLELGQKQEQEQEHDQNLETEGEEVERTEIKVGDAEEVFPVSPTILAFARKSIMQHASSSPKSIFYKLSNYKAVTTASNISNTPSSVTSHSIGENARLMKRKGQPKDAAITSTRTFIFKPMLKPSTSRCINASSSVQSSVSATLTSVSMPGLVEATAAEATHFSSPTGTYSHNSVLDFSGSSEPRIPSKARTSDKSINATSSTSTLSDIIAQPHPITLNAGSTCVQPRADPNESDLLKPLTMDMELEETRATTLSDSKKTAPFDLRSALWMDSGRTKYQMPNLIASLSPPTSPKHRLSPYKVPSSHERDVLRSRRLPSFKARPLNPKVFTSAGDLGVPRIPKKPLTVSRSPKFSKRRVRNVVTENKITKASVMNSAAATKLKKLTNPYTGTGKMSTTTTASSNAASHHQPPHQSQSQTGYECIEVGIHRDGQSTISTAAIKFGPLTVPTVGQTRAGMKLGTIKGPPLRTEDATSTKVAAIAATAITKPIGTSTASREAVVTTKDRPRSFIPKPKLRRPVTKPVPFKFSTAELQQRRMAFGPLPVITSTMTNNSTAASTIPITKGRPATIVLSSSSVLTVDDL
ncbi:hypothetical protein BX616_005954 [Lobosporangium transversale]|uniref:Uncharacterized protein n=1 Tax=Lobosporangium transversale TaxID=64571 RepID=A0A1Y2H0T3_9FUNG|nr:hypothetical protein BCR41DRAFT_418685 [Lobosporangium transversale]KAF9918762.1 hypothetical protein BX616_005954 [Lobosporangium transversale]ORZ27654.1 hypothetical protein BCR41DRAFT_418685 [Lobosporangium transversale]|eukprot:XP_021885357.1 hypothetical protein BCR41DRAFT_418685 [Lobosporangium transversale]